MIRCGLVVAWIQNRMMWKNTKEPIHPPTKSLTLRRWCRVVVCGKDIRSRSNWNRNRLKSQSVRWYCNTVMATMRICVCEREREWRSFCDGYVCVWVSDDRPIFNVPYSKGDFWFVEIWIQYNWDSFHESVPLSAFLAPWWFRRADQHQSLLGISAVQAVAQPKRNRHSKHLHKNKQ